LPLLLTTPTSTKHHPATRTHSSKISQRNLRLLPLDDQRRQSDSRLPTPEDQQPSLKCQLDNPVAHRPTGVRDCWSFTISTPIIKPLPRTSPTVGYRPTTSAAAPASFADNRCVPYPLAFEDIHRSQRSARHTGLPPKVLGVRTRHPIHQLRLRHADAKRHPASRSLRHADNIRLHARVSIAHTSRPSRARLAPQSAISRMPCRSQILRISRRSCRRNDIAPSP